VSITYPDIQGSGIKGILSNIFGSLSFGSFGIDGIDGRRTAHPGIRINNRRKRRIRFFISVIHKHYYQATIDYLMYGNKGIDGSNIC
tara:strand:+ start:101 stop:361 length:261 start_codon:yes stop_codon:yes gene_type:complete